MSQQILQNELSELMNIVHLGYPEVAREEVVRLRKTLPSGLPGELRQTLDQGMKDIRANLAGRPGPLRCIRALDTLQGLCLRLESASMQA